MTNKEILELIIKGDEKDALRAIEEVRKKAAKADDKMKKSSTATTKAISGFWGYMGAKIGNSVIKLTGAVLKFGVDSYKTFQQFEYSMAKVEAVTGGTEAQIGRLTDKVKILGATTQFTADQMANTAYNLGLAGLDTSQIEEALPALTNFSIATGTDLAKGADIATTSMNALGMEFTETTRFTDVVAKASVTSATSVAQMAEAFKKTAPTAGSLGIQVEELGTYLGLMADGGIRGSSAGTAMMNVLNRMDGSIPAAKKALDMLGVSAYDSEGNFRGLETVMGEMREGWGKLTQEEQTYVSKNLATQRGQAGFSYIMNTTTERLNEMKTGLYEAGGATEEMAKKMADTSKGINDRFISAVDGLKLAIGEELAPVIDDIKIKLTDWFNKLSGGEDSLSDFIESNKTFASEEYKVWDKARNDVLTLRQEFYDALEEGADSTEGLNKLLEAEKRFSEESKNIHKKHMEKLVTDYQENYAILSALVPDLEKPQDFGAKKKVEYEKTIKELDDIEVKLEEVYKKMDGVEFLSDDWMDLNAELDKLTNKKLEIGIEPLKIEADQLASDIEAAVNSDQIKTATETIQLKLGKIGQEHRQTEKAIKESWDSMKDTIDQSKMAADKKKELKTAFDKYYQDLLIKESASWAEKAMLIHETLGDLGVDFDLFGNKYGKLEGTTDRFKTRVDAASNSIKEEAVVLAESLGIKGKMLEVNSEYANTIDGMTVLKNGERVALEAQVSAEQLLFEAIMGNVGAYQELYRQGLLNKDAIIELATANGVEGQALEDLKASLDKNIDAKEASIEADQKAQEEANKTVEAQEGAKEAVDNTKEATDELADANTETLVPAVGETIEEQANLVESAEDVISKVNEVKDKMAGWASYINENFIPAVNSGIKKINELRDAITKIPKQTTIGVSFNIAESRTISKKYVDIKPSSPQVKNADGGIFNGKTQLGNHLFGEAGKEAIVPLTNSRTMQPFAKAIADNMERGNSGGDLNITIKEMNVRNDNDIKKIAKELESLRQRKTTQRR